MADERKEQLSRGPGLNGGPKAPKQLKAVRFGVPLASRSTHAAEITLDQLSDHHLLEVSFTL